MSRQIASYPSLKGKAVVITGGAQGIGAAMVRAFAGQGARVGFVDRDAKASAVLCADLPGVAHALCDLRDIAAMQGALAALTAEIGPAQVLVNNAAHDDRHDWQTVTPDYWDERQATNLRHMFFAIQALAPGMIAAGAGSIVNISSSSWLEGMGGLPGYTAAKAAIHGLTRSFARDLGPHRIRVNTVVPGWVMTDRQKALWVTPEALEGRLARQCLPALIQPEDVARMVLFLASDEAAMCTGADFRVEAGSI